MARAAPSRGRQVAYLVRHAEALSRGSWPRPDRERPLSELGRRQANAIAGRLAPGAGAATTLTRALSSPALRCRETLGPTAARAGLAVEEVDDLEEGSDPLEALRAVLRAASSEADGSTIAACSHGDVIDGILESLAPARVTVVGALRAPKASVWELEILDGELRHARYLPPPVGARG
ncbi:MAG TPA: phosphoglycerate mutase family protein [Acidimicrobiales bacterium]|nr:phosphoglycerate mutase family protein [Acidimicrobiales bacterium]